MFNNKIEKGGRWGKERKREIYRKDEMLCI
jgi:hypothetical protein